MIDRTDRTIAYDRGQAHTLEAFVAALLLVGGVIFALQATAVTPLSASTSNQHIENELRTDANDLLAVTAANGDLERAVLECDPGNATTRGGPANGFGAALNETFVDRGVAVSVRVIYRNDSGVTFVDPMVDMGDPSDSAVTSSRPVSVPTDELCGEPTVEHAQAEVEVTVWRM